MFWQYPPRVDSKSAVSITKRCSSIYKDRAPRSIVGYLPSPNPFASAVPREQFVMSSNIAIGCGAKMQRGYSRPHFVLGDTLPPLPLGLVSQRRGIADLIVHLP